MATEQFGPSAQQSIAGQESLGVIDQETFLDIRSRAHERVLLECEAAQLSRMTLDRKIEQVRESLTAALKDAGLALPSRLRDRLVDEVMDEIVGYGPIQPLLDDPTITEVMVNGPRKVYVERDGIIEPTSKVFKDDLHVMRIIEKIVTPLGRRIDESQPMVDARLPDGSRVNAIIPPLSVTGPTLTIRKFSRIPYTVHDLISFGTMSEEMADFLRACVIAKLNILISGGTGSGKTTSLNVISSFVPENERIVTIEDAAELQLQQEHVVSLESRPSNLEGKGEITIRQLVRNSLRMRPDRIIVGEVRGGEALDMLQAMNTGHDGSLSTAHTNSPRDSIARLETMTLMAGTDLPSRAIREQIAAAMNLIVHQNRLRDGSRKITHITEVQGMEGDVIVLQDLFLFEQTGIDASGRVLGKHKATGLRPKFVSKLKKEGVELTTDIFKVA
ncbi:MAG: CpaF family protein [Armatimonadota bacterium]|nr:CpaF family protein [Armatimonadota bacterium]